ncbi:hypothetical protein [Paenibacillus glacialis]|uniref:Uncharacterized protein n=1 Tax=Paenibacillus glacialis TaxID=494026 RepID=A0A168FA02_9BACL|nr:hypothetical protein [Paenibacillus glacialis]OAB35999.1 hypothetical protein PGLA_21475 [Paenibacillus glacialis]
MLYQNNDNIVKMHLINLQQDAERSRIVHQVRATEKELSQLNRKTKRTTKERQSIIGRLFNMGNRMF